MDLDKFIVSSLEVMMRISKGEVSEEFLVKETMDVIGIIEDLKRVFDNFTE